MLERSCPIVLISSVGLESPSSVQVVKASGETVQSFSLRNVDDPELTGCIPVRS